ncbi:MAG: DNA repair protein RecN [Planctomycetota bacterium]|nr:MAG: DNA repair protein RecN [Planctomycetota bacterium]
MLEELSIQNLGLIKSLNVSFCEGLNVITGETGVGKSMLLGAFGLLMGGRAHSNLVRHDEAKASVTGVFRLKKSLLDILKKDFDDYIEDDELILRRVVTAEGRSKSYIGDTPVTLAVLKELTSKIVDVHGQNEHQALMKKDIQIKLLDRFSGCEKQRIEFAELLKTIREKQRLLDDYAFNEKKRKDDLEYFAYQIEEFEKLNPQENELNLLNDKIRSSSNMQKIAELSASIKNAMVNSEDSVMSLISNIQNSLEQLEGYDEKYTNWNNCLQEALPGLEELRDLVQNDSSLDELSPLVIDEMISRAESLKRLYAKHNFQSGEESEALVVMRDKLDALEQSIAAPEKLEKEINISLEKAFGLGLKLFKKRKSSAKKLEKQIEIELNDLGMPDAKLQVSVSQKIKDPSSLLQGASSLGLDEIEFMFMPNPGAPFKKLRDIASGGELARTMLAVIKVLSEVDETSLLIFDEIDANIGGRLGVTIGNKMIALTKSHQVICVTHLPQIAGFANQQFKISKSVVDGNTTTSIKVIEGESRVNELAEMIQGDGVNDVTLLQAKELLQS